MRNLRHTIFGLFLLVIGCNIQDINLKNIKVENLQSEQAIPLGTSSYTMRELIEGISDSELMLQEDPVTSELILRYRDTAKYTFSPDIFHVLDISNTNIIDLPDTPDNGMIRTVNADFPFAQTYTSVKEEIIDSVFHATTSMVTVDIVSTSTLDIPYNLELTNTTNTRTGNAVSFSGTLSGGTAMNHRQSLVNHKTTFTEVAGKNNFDVNLALDVTLNAGASFSNDQISVTIHFLDQDFVIAFGKLGQDTVAISGETLAIDFFDKIGLSGFEFGKPEISWDFRNSFGLPIGVGFGGIFAEANDGTRTFLRGAIVSTPPVIEGSSVEVPVTGEIRQTTVTINASNSTLQNLMATSPSRLGFDVQGFTNPYAPSVINFATDTSSITSYIEVVMPMTVRLTNVQYTLDFDLEKESVYFSEIDSLTLRMVTINELPFAATVNMLILNADEDTLYTVLNKRALDVPFLNFDRTVKEPKTNIEDVPLTRAGVDALNKGETLRVVITMNSPKSKTAEDIFVKLLGSAQLEVTLAISVVIDKKL